MTTRNLVTGAQNTWCPGCGNFVIQFAIKFAIEELVREGVDLDRIVLVSGIGCHAKMADYLDINSFYSIHGRTLPVATAIKMANPDLVVLACAGDGDCYAEGLDHLIFTAKRNPDITLIVHNNRVYGLTTGQYTPTSPLGFRGRSTPGGTIEGPFNPLKIMLSSGATYVARGCTRRKDLLKEVILEGLHHRGFSFIDVLQVCASYYNLSDFYDGNVYEIKDHDQGDYGAAYKKAGEWDYDRDALIGLGILYRAERATLEERLAVQRGSEKDRNGTIQKILKERS